MFTKRRIDLITPMSKPYRRRTISTVGRAYSTDPLERIAFISGTNANNTSWSLSQPAAVALIEQGTDEFFFRKGDTSVRVVVLTSGGEKYLQSEREKTHPDDMLNLMPSVAISAPQMGVSPSGTRRRR
jgi:hypothetical protein